MNLEDLRRPPPKCCLDSVDTPCEGALSKLPETGNWICRGHELEIINRGLVLRLMRSPVEP